MSNLSNSILRHRPGVESFFGSKAVIVFVGIMLLGSIPLYGEEKKALRVVVDELIGALDADTLIDRSHAERQLIELGPEVLVLLPAPELIESANARDAIRRIRPKLERQAARESSAPFPVTLKGELPLIDLLKEIQRQSKNEIVPVDDTSVLADRRLNVDWVKTHFWDCIDDVCQRESLQWKFAKDAAAIQISSASETAKAIIAVQRIGPFRLEIQEIEIRPVIGDDQHKVVRVDGRLSVEPRLRPLFLSMAVENLKAMANVDSPLPPWNPGAKYEFPVTDGGHEVPIQWDFLLPAIADLKTVSIRGRLQCQIAAATERVVFDHTSQTRGTTRRRGGVTVRLRQVNFEPLQNEQSNAEIGIMVSYDSGGPAFESHRTWIFHNAVYLETKTGQRTAYTDFEIAQQADGAVAVDYRWRNVAGPASQYLFVYEAPTLIIDVPIDVEVDGLTVNPPLTDSQKVQKKK